MIVLDRVCNVAAFASTDETRHSLTFVHIDPANNRVEATNGHFAIRAPLPPNQPDDTGKDSMFVPADLLAQAFKTLPKKKTAPQSSKQIGIEVQESKVTIYDQKGERSFPSEKINFPTTDAVWPVFEKTSHKYPRIGLGTKYMKIISDWLWSFREGRDDTTVPNLSMILPDDPLSPIEYRAEPETGREVSIVLMPVRL